MMSTIIKLAIALFVFCFLIGFARTFVPFLRYPIGLGVASWICDMGFWPGCIVGLIIGIVKLIRDPGSCVVDVAPETTMRRNDYADSDDCDDSSSNSSGQCRYYEYGCGSGRCGLSVSDREDDYCPYDGWGEGRCSHHR